MLRAHSEDSKLTGWYLEIDRGLLGFVLCLITIGVFMTITAGAAQAAHMIPAQSWYFFLLKAAPLYCLGLVSLFVFSMLNKKQIIWLSLIGLIIGVVLLLMTVVHPVYEHGSSRWVHLFGFSLMPTEILKPSFVILTAWFLSKMRSIYGPNMFVNKNAWKLKFFSWIPYLIFFATIILIVFRHPDVGNAFLYVGVLGVMLFVAVLPWRLVFVLLGFVVFLIVAALMVMPHVRARAMQMFHVQPRTQVWYSLNAIKNGGLLGAGDEAFVKDVLPESANDFVFATIAEDWGALLASCVIILLFVVLSRLIKHAMEAKDDFVVYAVSGVAALFGGQICFNLMTTLHLLMNKGMTLPFISYGGWAFLVFCVLFGMVLALVREDSWN